MIWAVVAGVAVLIPITAILTEHQRRMAEIRVKANGQDADRLRSLEQRMVELTELVHQQTIAVDSLVGQERVESRINA